MFLKAHDFFRSLAWKLLSFIYNLIDNLFDILKSLNSFDIIDSVSGNNNFSIFQKSIIAIAVTLLGLFAITRFVKKIIDPDESQSSENIVKEIVKCGLLIIFSTFLFVQASNFSIQLSGFTANIFDNKKVSISDSMLSMYIEHDEDYKKTDDYEKEDIEKEVKDGKFDDEDKLNDKYKRTKTKKKAYKYKINFIMATIVGGFFLYSLFFTGMMLARKQIEFLFLFIISPIVFATSIGNKDRRSAVTQSLVSLVLQGAVIMLIISLTAIIMREINVASFFDNYVKDVIVKSLMYLGCGTFLLTGSQVVNKFIGGNVSANQGREQMMAMAGFGNMMGGLASAGGAAAGGAAMVGVGALSKVANLIGINKVGNALMGKVGQGISSFGGKLQGGALGGIGAGLSNIGEHMQGSSKKNLEKRLEGKSGLSKFGGNMMKQGGGSIGSAVKSMLPIRTRKHTKW